MFMKQADKYHMVAIVNICFEKKLVRSPAEIICFALSFVSLWAELHRQEHRVALEAGAEALK